VSSRASASSRRGSPRTAATGTRRPSAALAVAMLVTASACWGLATAMSKVVLAQLTPLDLFGCEVCIGAVCLCALALARGARPSRPSAKLLALGALEPGIAFVLFDFGIDHTAATHASLLLSTETLFTVSLAILLLGERLSARLAVALAAGVAGSVLVAWHAGGAHASLLGDALVIAASLAAAGYAVLARHIAPGQDPVVVSAVQMLGALAIAGPPRRLDRRRRHSPRQRRFRASRVDGRGRADGERRARAPIQHGGRARVRDERRADPRARAAVRRRRVDRSRRRGARWHAGRAGGILVILAAALAASRIETAS
jgi:uncharacterized membrane protein